MMVLGRCPFPPFGKLGSFTMAPTPAPTSAPNNIPPTSGDSRIHLCSNRNMGSRWCGVSPCNYFSRDPWPDVGLGADVLVTILPKYVKSARRTRPRGFSDYKWHASLGTLHMFRVQHPISTSTPAWHERSSAVRWSPLSWSFNNKLFFFAHFL